MSTAEGNLEMSQYQAKHGIRFVALANRQEAAKERRTMQGKQMERVNETARHSPISE